MPKNTFIIIEIKLASTPIHVRFMYIRERELTLSHNQNKMNSRSNTVGSHQTSIRTQDGKTFIRYHQTDVVIFDENGIKLQTGGWMSRTTKLRMNQASQQFALGFGISQKNGSWFVMINDDSIPFTDGMELCRMHFGRKVAPFLPIVGVPA